MRDPEPSSRYGGTAESVLYLFCFALSERLGRPPPPVFSVVHGRVAALLKEVPLADYSGPAAEENARDLAWIAPRALEHNETIERIWRESPVLPARFGTLYSSQEALRRFVSSHRQAIEEFLERVDGKSEWAVKGFLDRERAREELLARSREATGKLASSPGTRYIHERKLRQKSEQELRRWLREIAAELERALSAHAADVRERRPLPTEDGPGSEMVFNWAWLVDDDRVDAFRAAAERLNEEYVSLGFACGLAGPFPPYSFVPALAEAADEGGAAASGVRA